MARRRTNRTRSGCPVVAASALHSCRNGKRTGGRVTPWLKALSDWSGLGDLRDFAQGALAPRERCDVMRRKSVRGDRRRFGFRASAAEVQTSADAVHPRQGVTLCAKRIQSQVGKDLYAIAPLR